MNKLIPFVFVLVCAAAVVGCGSSHGGGGGVTTPVGGGGDGGPLTVTSSRVLPDATVGVPYSTQLQVTGGYTPYHWGIEQGQSLPRGLTISDGGLISGTPVTPQDARVVFTLTDSGIAGRDVQSTVAAFSLSVK